jgi:hypothetical protein
MSLPASAQTSAVQSGAPPATTQGQDLKVGLGGYNYVEPGNHSISIHGAKLIGEYAGTFVPGEGPWFVRASVGARVGRTNYDGWCGPWRITPDSRSANGYRLTIGDYSPCQDSGDGDWYIEGRAMAGRDFAGRRWTWSPAAGLGIRHLSNGLSGVSGYRTDDYLSLPLGLTARTRMGARGVLGLNVEFDQLIRGWQTTFQSRLGGGTVAATPSAPAFTINGFTDISFEQQSGRALRAGATYELNRRWLVEPYWVRWTVGASPVNQTTVTFTVNDVAAGQQLGFYEPRNTTNEFGLKVGIRIR